jgi:hypothetical protein
MPYKNDNLEELFQNAAGDYPLKTNNSNWNSVASKLNITTTGKTSGKKYRFLTHSIFILLLLSGFLILYKSEFKSQPLVNQEIKPATKKVTGNADTSQIPKYSVINNQVNVSSTAKNGSVIKFRRTNSSNGINEQVVAPKNYAYQGNSVENKDLTSQKLPADNIPNITTSNLSVNSKNNQSIKTGNANTNSVSAKNNSLISNNAGSVKQVVKFRPAASRFYGTLYGGPEFSMVKFQHLTNSGYQLGVSLGYRINDRFDVEIGLQREHINYYTNGKYFQKSGLKLQDPVALENVDGRSKITSVPLTLKYNFKPHNYGHFYATSGFDAILLTHTEGYKYVISKNGNENDRSKKYSSVTGPKYFTAINASAGYETKLSNWCNMKIEPYYQLPLSNIGVGKVPITSFGINIGIVKNLR